LKFKILLVTAPLSWPAIIPDVGQAALSASLPAFRG
jgi:hypothetical protein